MATLLNVVHPFLLVKFQLVKNRYFICNKINNCKYLNMSRYREWPSRIVPKLQ